MKVLIRNTQNGLFYAGLDQWTPTAEEALNFEGTDRAFDEAARAHPDAVEVLIKFENPEFEIPLSLVVPAEPA